MAIGGGTLKAYIDSTSNVSSFNTTTHGGGQWTPIAGRFYVAFLCVTRASPMATVTLSGNGLTWVSKGSQNITMAVSGDVYRGMCWVADGTGGALGDTTVGLTSACTNCQLAIHEYTGTSLDTAGTGAGKAIGQIVVGGTATGATSGSLTLASPLNAANRCASMFVHEQDEVATPQSGWTEVSDRGDGPPAVAMETQRRLDAFDTAVGASWALTRGWIGIAVELGALQEFDTSVGMIPI